MSPSAAAVEIPPVGHAARARVCILAETFHPMVGGGETQALLLAQQLVGRGYPVTVLTRRWMHDLAYHERLGDIEIHRLAPPGPGGNKRWPMIAFAAHELWRRRDHFDVVLVLGFRALGLAAVAARRYLGVPCVFKAESNGELSGEFFGPGLLRLGLTPAVVGVRHLLRARNRAFRGADAFVALSSALEQEFIEAGVPPSSIRRIPNGVDTEIFRPAAPGARGEVRRALGLDPEETLVTYTGRLVSYKGLPLLLEVWKQIAREVPNARLVLVGEGGGDIHNCEAELRSFVTANGLQDRVVFTGPTNRVHLFLQASDVFAFPTENEAFGLSLVEAMACGLACVVSAVGGVPDIVTDGVDGILIPPCDGRLLHDSLWRLLAEPETRRTLGQNAREMVLDRFSVEAVTDAYAGLIDTLTGLRPRLTARAAGAALEGG